MVLPLARFAECRRESRAGFGKWDSAAADEPHADGIVQFKRHGHDGRVVRLAVRTGGDREPVEPEKEVRHRGAVADADVFLPVDRRHHLFGKVERVLNLAEFDV